MYHGIINVYKEAGFTSHDVVAKLRGICGQKKIGHTGTLDPGAEGVLPVCLGNGTGLCHMLTDKDKEYVAVLRLGLVTDTQDMTGTVLEEKEVTVSETEAEQAVLSFVGAYRQIPPMYSAVRVNGKRLYELAREGKEVEREARPVRIEAVEILSVRLPEITIRVSCSKGTYIRTLCHDIGVKLGCGGTMAALRRTRSGDFTVGTSYTLGQLQQLADEGRMEEAIRRVDEMFQHLPPVEVQERFHNRLINGNPIYRDQIRKECLSEPAEEVRVYGYTGDFYGIYRYRERELCFYPVKMFIPGGAVRTGQ